MSSKRTTIGESGRTPPVELVTLTGGPLDGKVRHALRAENKRRFRVWGDYRAGTPDSWVTYRRGNNGIWTVA